MIILVYWSWLINVVILLFMMALLYSEESIKYALENINYQLSNYKIISLTTIKLYRISVEQSSNEVNQNNRITITTKRMFIIGIKI